MVSRQNSARRRRIVIDPHHQRVEKGTSSDDTQFRPRKRKRTLYKTGSERRYQWKTTDLLPKRTWGIVISNSLLIFAILALNGLQLSSARWGHLLGTSGVASFQLTGASTLAAWFSSFLLIVSGFASLQIYALRQHRQDDYRGSYRLWLWMAAILLIASVDCVADMTSIGTHLVQSLTKLSVNSSLLGVITIQLVLLTSLIARGVYEVRESRSTLALVLLVWLAYGAATTLRLPQLQPVMSIVDTRTLQLIQGNLVLLGTSILFMAHLLFARFVYLQALGMIQPQVTKRAKQKSKSKTTPRSKSTKSKSNKSVESDLDENNPSRKAESEPSDRADRTSVSRPDADVGEKSDTQRNRSILAAGTSATPKREIDRLSKNGFEQSKRKDSNSEIEDDAQREDEEIFQLSKSEQRRRRKLQQQQHRRAA